jgi:hypothetical protein
MGAACTRVHHNGRTVIWLLLLTVLTIALLSEALLDSSVGAWIAVGAVSLMALLRLLGGVTGWPSGNGGE